MKVERVDKIALNEALTEEVLLREIFGQCKDSFWIRRRKEKVLYDLKRLFELFPALKGLHDERFIIYSFIRLWEEGRVEKFNFGKAWREHIVLVLMCYAEHYNEKIKSTQRKFKI